LSVVDADRSTCPLTASRCESYLLTYSPAGGGFAVVFEVVVVSWMLVIVVRYWFVVYSNSMDIKTVDDPIKAQ
jgi:hypothetical protein